MFYKILAVVLRCLFRIFFSAKIIGLENVPKNGALILAANHMSNFDPPFLGSFSPRPVHYMAKIELFQNKIFAKIISSLYSFPVKRGAADKNAIKHATGLLKDEKTLGIFPEGTRSKTGEVGKGEVGVALLASMTNAAVVPVAIIGTNEMFSEKKTFPKLTLIFGEPIKFTGNRKNREELENFSDKIIEEIKKLKASHQENNE